MNFRYLQLFATILLMLSCTAQGTPKPENPTAAVLRYFQVHDIVMFAETHGNKEEYEWLRSLVATPEFSDRVDDIVLEFGNSLYQKSVDRYIAGEDVPLEQVQKAWRNMVGAAGPPSPLYGSLYTAVRESNIKRRGKHSIRILCGDPYIDWEKVKNREDIAPYLSNRDEWYTQVVKDEVLAKHHRALLIMGSEHFLRNFPRPFSIEQQLRLAGARTYLIVAGTNTTGGYEDLDHRFGSWHAPVIVSLANNWVGELPAMPVISGGLEEPRAVVAQPQPSSIKGGSTPAPSPLTLKDAADALLYLGTRDSLSKIFMPRAELEGTPYAKEFERRLKIELGQPINIIPKKDVAPQFPRPQAEAGDEGASSLLPPPVCENGCVLPPRPTPQ